MPRGYPDDNIQSSPLGQTVADNAELAARLGSLSTVQRSGQVVYMTKFANGNLDWLVDEGGNGRVRTLANAGHLDTTCLSLWSGSGAGDYAHIQKILPLVDFAKGGCEFYLDFPYPGVLLHQHLTMTVKLNHGGYNHFFAVDFIPIDNQIVLQTYNQAGAADYQTIDVGYDLSSATYVNLWHYVKLTFDGHNNKWGILYFNNLALNLSSYYGTQAAASYGGYFSVVFSLPYEHTSYYTRLGSFMVTMNEP